MVAIALTPVFAYSGAKGALVIGYIVGALSGGLLSPSLGALLTELFPTSVRASVTGWSVTAGVVGAVCGLVVFGAVADVGNRFALAAEVTFLPMVAAASLFWLLPETKGREPESLWPAPSKPSNTSHFGAVCRSPRPCYAASDVNSVSWSAVGARAVRSSCSESWRCSASTSSASASHASSDASVFDTMMVSSSNLALPPCLAAGW